MNILYSKYYLINKFDKKNNSYELYIHQFLYYNIQKKEQILFLEVEIHYFDNKESFRNYVYELRGEKESLPKYAVGTGADGMIIAYIDPSIKEGTPIFRKRKCLAAHELFHIMYHELIIFKTRQEYFTWFDEGCAQFFSGEKDYELNGGQQNFTVAEMETFQISFN